jgi:hypothetical protein
MSAQLKSQGGRIAVLTAASDTRATYYNVKDTSRAVDFFTFFLLKGLHLYGTKFTGASGMVGYTALQTPLHFERLEGGGLQNHAMLLVHYTKQNSVETISF